MLSPSIPAFPSTAADRAAWAHMLTAVRALTPEIRRDAAATDSPDDFPAASFRLLAEAGVLAAPLPRALGGVGLGAAPGSTLALLRLLAALGKGSLVVGRVFEGHCNALLLIEQFGTPEQLRRYARDVTTHHHLFGVWNTEAADGVKLTPNPAGGYRLRGAKTFATGTGHVARPLVNGALPDGGWQMSVVPMDAVETCVDAAWWRPLGMRASGSYRVDFGGVVLRSDALIGRPGDYYQQPGFGGGAIRFAAVQLGGAEALFEETRRYLRALHRTDDPYQRQRLGQMALAVETGRHWLVGAAHYHDRYAAHPDAANCEQFLAYANLTRTAIFEVCERTMQLCAACVGARGLNAPHAFERIIRDLTMYLRQPAPDAALASAGGYVLATDWL